MLEALKTPAGAYNLSLIFSIIIWLISGFGICVGIHQNRVDATAADQAKAETNRRIEEAETAVSSLSLENKNLLSKMAHRSVDAALAAQLDEIILSELPVRITVGSDAEAVSFTGLMFAYFHTKGAPKPAEGFIIGGEFGKFRGIRISNSGSNYEIWIGPKE